MLLTIFFWLVILAGLVNVASTIYVRCRYGADMVDSHLHGGITERWFKNALKLIVFLIFFFLTCFAIVMFEGQWPEVIKGLLTWLKLTLELPIMIVVSAFKILFGA